MKKKEIFKKILGAVLMMPVVILCSVFLFALIKITLEIGFLKVLFVGILLIVIVATLCYITALGVDLLESPKNRNLRNKENGKHI